MINDRIAVSEENGAICELERFVEVLTLYRMESCKVGPKVVFLRIGSDEGFEDPDPTFAGGDVLDEIGKIAVAQIARVPTRPNHRDK